MSVLRFQMNGNISLNCSLTNRIALYHQNPESGRLTLLMSALGSSNMPFTIYQNSCLTVKADPMRQTVSVVITGLTESDSGLYFCGAISVNSDMRFEMHFENPIRIQIEG